LWGFTSTTRGKEDKHMHDEKVSTEVLLQRLFKASGAGDFFRQFDELTDFVPFPAYLKRLCAKRNVTPAFVIKKADIERSFGHQLFNGRRSPSRDKALQLAFGFGMNYDETQNLLKMSRKSLLYPKVKRDAAIIYALVNGFDVTAAQATLYELNLPLLGKEERKYE
jgi:hypothetical protein